jgi:hypothetical protein
MYLDVLSGPRRRRIGYADYATARLKRSSRAGWPVCVAADASDFTPQAHQFPAI